MHAALPLCLCVCVWVDHVLGSINKYLSLSLSFSVIGPRYAVCNKFLRNLFQHFLQFQNSFVRIDPRPNAAADGSGSLPNPFAALQQQNGIKKAANTQTHRPDYKSPHACLRFYTVEWVVERGGRGDCSP